MGKHILVVSQYFYPEVFRINDICQEWMKRGYRVTVLTGIPNYPEGKFYSGYGLTKKRRETWHGIDIIRLPIIARGHTEFRLSLNYLSFVVSGFFWKLFTRIKPDLVFTYEVSPMTQALIGAWLAKKRKIPHYLYVTDLWPQSVETITGIKSPFLIGPICKMLEYVYDRCEKILVSSPGFVKDIEGRLTEKEGKVIYWPQYAEDFYRPVEKKGRTEIPDDGVFNIVFAGNIGYAQGLETLVGAAEVLRERCIRVRFNIIGDGRYKPELTERIKSTGTGEYFNFIGKKPPEEIPEYFAHADALLICLSKSDVFAMTIPGKTQSCMACGKAILASADGEVQKIIRDSDSGLASAAEDAVMLADNIVAMAQMPKAEILRFGENAQRYSQEHFDKKALLDLTDEIFGGSGRTV